MADTSTGGKTMDSVAAIVYLMLACVVVVSVYLVAYAISCLLWVASCAIRETHVYSSNFNKEA